MRIEQGALARRGQGQRDRCRSLLARLPAEPFGEYVRVGAGPAYQIAQGRPLQGRPQQVIGVHIGHSELCRAPGRVDHELARRFAHQPADVDPVLRPVGTGSEEPGQKLFPRLGVEGLAGGHEFGSAAVTSARADDP